MLDLTVQCACDHPSLRQDVFSYLPNFPTDAEYCVSFLIPLQTRGKTGCFFFFFFWKREEGERANRYCSCFFSYLSFPWSDDHLSRPQVPAISLVVSTAGKSSLVSALRKETLLFTDGQRKKTNHSRIKSTASYLIILRFEQLVLQEISHMTSCLQKSLLLPKEFPLECWA